MGIEPTSCLSLHHHILTLSRNYKLYRSVPGRNPKLFSCDNLWDEDFSCVQVEGQFPGLAEAHIKPLKDVAVNFLQRDGASMKEKNSSNKWSGAEAVAKR